MIRILRDRLNIKEKPHLREWGFFVGFGFVFAGARLRLVPNVICTSETLALAGVLFCWREAEACADYYMHERDARASGGY